MSMLREQAREAVRREFAAAIAKAADRNFDPTPFVRDIVRLYPEAAFTFEEALAEFEAIRAGGRPPPPGFLRHRWR